MNPFYKYFGKVITRTWVGAIAVSLSAGPGFSMPIRTAEEMENLRSISDAALALDVMNSVKSVAPASACGPDRRAPGAPIGEAAQRLSEAAEEGRRLAAEASQSDCLNPLKSQLDESLECLSKITADLDRGSFRFALFGGIMQSRISACAGKISGGNRAREAAFYTLATKHLTELVSQRLGTIQAKLSAGAATDFDTLSPEDQAFLSALSGSIPDADLGLGDQVSRLSEQELARLKTESVLAHFQDRAKLQRPALDQLKAAGARVTTTGLDFAKFPIHDVQGNPELQSALDQFFGEGTAQNLIRTVTRRDPATGETQLSKAFILGSNVIVPNYDPAGLRRSVKGGIRNHAAVLTREAYEAQVHDEMEALRAEIKSEMSSAEDLNTYWAGTKRIGASLFWGGGHISEDAALNSAQRKVSARIAGLMSLYGIDDFRASAILESSLLSTRYQIDQMNRSEQKLDRVGKAAIGTLAAAGVIATGGWLAAPASGLLASAGLTTAAASVTTGSVISAGATSVVMGPVIGGVLQVPKAYFSSEINGGGFWCHLGERISKGTFEGLKPQSAVTGAVFGMIMPGLSGLARGAVPGVIAKLGLTGKLSQATVAFVANESVPFVAFGARALKGKVATLASLRKMEAEADELEKSGYYEEALALRNAAVEQASDLTFDNRVVAGGVNALKGRISSKIGSAVGPKVDWFSAGKTVGQARAKLNRFGEQTFGKVATLGAPRPFTHSEVWRNSNLSDTQRLELAERELRERGVIDAPLTDQMKSAILKAHALETKNGILAPDPNNPQAARSSFTPSELLAKARILKEAGIPPEKFSEFLNVIVRGGFAGTPGTPPTPPPTRADLEPSLKQANEDAIKDKARRVEDRLKNNEGDVDAAYVGVETNRANGANVSKFTRASGKSPTGLVDAEKARAQFAAAADDLVTPTAGGAGAGIASQFAAAKASKPASINGYDPSGAKNTGDPILSIRGNGKAGAADSGGIEIHRVNNYANSTGARMITVTGKDGVQTTVVVNDPAEIAHIDAAAKSISARKYVAPVTARAGDSPSDLKTALAGAGAPKAVGRAPGDLVKISEDVNGFASGVSKAIADAKPVVSSDGSRVSYQIAPPGRVLDPRGGTVKPREGMGIEIERVPPTDPKAAPSYRVRVVAQRIENPTLPPGTPATLTGAKVAHREALVSLEKLDATQSAAFKRLMDGYKPSSADISVLQRAVGERLREAAKADAVPKPAADAPKTNELGLVIEIIQDRLRAAAAATSDAP